MNGVTVSSDPAGEGRIFAFGRFELDTKAWELRKSGRRVRVSPQPLRVLSLLVEHAGETIERTALTKLIWGETVVDYDRSLNACIRKIRFALGDEPDSPTFVETVPRRGYRFIAPVEVVDAVPKTRFRWRPVIAAGAFVVMALAGVIAFDRYGPEPTPVAAPAYDAYLKGSYHLKRGTEDSLRASVGHFLAAIEQEPAYPDAHAGLARAYNELAPLGPQPAEAGHGLAASAARRALESEPELVDAQLELAIALWFGEWRWARAGELFEEALRENPENARLHHWYGYFLACRGEHPESIRAVERALELDPLSREINADVGYFYYLASDDERAVAACERTLELEPDFPLARTCLIEANWSRGALEAAALHASALMKEAPAGEPESVLEAFDEARAQADGVPAYLRAISHVRRGEHDEALAQLKAAIQDRSAWVAAMNVDPALAPLRRHPRFAELRESLRVEAPRLATLR